MSKRKLFRPTVKKVVFGASTDEVSSIVKVLQQEQVVTTPEHAKKLGTLFDEIVSKAKKDNLSTRRRLRQILRDELVVNTVIESIKAQELGLIPHSSRQRAARGSQALRYIDITDIGKVERGGHPMVLVKIRPTPARKDRGGQGQSQVSKLLRAGPEPAMATKLVIAKFNAADRDALCEIAKAVDMKVFGFGRPGNHVLASKSIRDGADPAFLQLTRDGADSTTSFRFSATWVGTPPNLLDSIEDVSRVLKLGTQTHE